MAERIYLDHGATTPLDPRVQEAMMPFFTEKFGNASSLHSFGREAKEAMEIGREQVQKLIGAKIPEEVIFTAGGTESDNIALHGVALKNKDKGNHIITSSVEHAAIEETCKFLESHGFEVTYLKVDNTGLVDQEELRESFTDRTILVSIIYGNSEIGTVQDLEDLIKITKEHDTLFHTDAVQAVGKIPIDVQALGLDMLSMSSHKIHGPKGVGAIYIRRGTQISPIVFGGGHEFGMRSSTENVPGIVGIGKAADIARVEEPEERPRIMALRDKLKDGIMGSIDDAILNGHLVKRLPNHASIRFPGLVGETLLLRLSMMGIAVSTGSACHSGKGDISNTMNAIGLTPEDASSCVRMTLGRFNTDEEIDRAVAAVIEQVGKVRKMSS